ncbi:MAG: transcription antitermination factor NusB [Actinomycetota bacterium]|nr:transcription antitermination factor NusB [Actinomycetota bacterium]
MKSRRAGRRLALDVLYEAEIRGDPGSEVFTRHQMEGWVTLGPADEESPKDTEHSDQPSPEAVGYALELVQGVESHRAEVDSLIGSYAQKWELERMPIIDLTLLRMAIFELLWRDDIPAPVTINEAVELAKGLSTESSGRFINGILGRLSKSQEVQ